MTDNHTIMNRKEEIRSVAAEKYKESDFRTPNMFCFIEGAEWAVSLHQHLIFLLTFKKTLISRIFDNFIIDAFVRRLLFQGLKIRDRHQS